MTQTSPNPHSPVRKPRTALRFPQNRSAPRQWQIVDTADDSLDQVATALAQWTRRTGHRADILPSDSHIRRCDVARELRLHSLIVRAGGYRAVQIGLGLRPMESSAQLTKERELAELAACLTDVLSAAGRPAPQEVFPDKRVIQKLSPRLGNRIAAFPGRNGYHRLGVYVRAGMAGLNVRDERKEGWSPGGKWRVWTDPLAIRADLLAYQLHPQVLPRLNALPTELSSAIQRKGGAASFVLAEGMVLEKDWANITRLARVVRWLADEVLDDGYGPTKEVWDPEEYLGIIRDQINNPPPFPTLEHISKAGIMNEIQRYGGRKSLALRLGFSSAYGLRDVFMGPFSVQFAADILDFASRQVYVCDGSVAMPTVEIMRNCNRHDLADATFLFEGEESVGRRVGLVPQIKGDKGEIIPHC